MSQTEFTQYGMLFQQINHGGPVNRSQAASIFSKAKLPSDEVDLIWALCDEDMDGYLSRHDFALALHIAACRHSGAPLPEQRPSTLLPADLAETDPPPRAASASLPTLASPEAGFAPHDDADNLQHKSARSRFKFGGGRKSTPPPGAAAAPPSAQQQQRASASPGEPPQMEHPTPGGGGGAAPEYIHRSGGLNYSKKARWCVLSDGQLAVFASKAEVTKAPKLSVDLRSDVSRVVCNDLKSFKLELHATSKHARGNLPKGSSTAVLVFSSDDGQELAAWANDVTNAWKGLRRM